MFYLLFFSNSIFSLPKTSPSLSSNEFSRINYLSYSTPDAYSFKLPAGRYKITCYGAQGGLAYNGGNIASNGGKGAKVSGYINVDGSGKTFYAVVGDIGKSRSTGLADGGFNGGGNSGWNKKYKHHWHSKQFSNGPGGGGGASDIRINTNEYTNRIMVAAGGSGAAINLGGAPGGDLTGYTINGPSSRTTQTEGNENGQGSNGATAKHYPSTGGGGGYRGGMEGTASNSDPVGSIADSGSSYISGYQGCTSHPEIKFDSGKMEVGVREGIGYIQIDQVYECPSHCERCSGSNQCTECEQDYIIHEGLCYPSCPAGTINRYSYCEPCHQSCSACSELATNCTSCIDGYYLYENKCVSICPVGYGYNGECFDNCPSGTFATQNVCDECSVSCKECEDTDTKCTDCHEGTYLFNNECVEKCPDRTVREGNKCVTECSNGQFLYDGICYKSCPRGTYKNGLTCEDCSSNCAECRENPNTCLKCHTGMYLYKSTCYDSCPNDFYSYESHCISDCPQLTFIDGKKCYDECPKGKFAVDQICTSCDSSCASCFNSSSNCTECQGDTYLYNNKCNAECPERTYKYGNKCLNECPDGTFTRDNECKNEISFYEVEEIVKREPKVSKKVIKIVLPIVVVVFAIEAGLAIWMLLCTLYIC